MHMLDVAIVVVLCLAAVCIALLERKLRKLEARLDEFNHEQLAPTSKIVRRDADKFRTL